MAFSPWPEARTCFLAVLWIGSGDETKAKTRLGASIGHEAACSLATAFISDFISMAMAIEWAYPVLATTSDGIESFPQLNSSQVAKKLKT